MRFGTLGLLFHALSEQGNQVDKPQQYYAAGNFLVSGRQIPREGGIILALGESREEIEAIMREDPFCQRGLADCRVIEFRTSQRADDMPKRIGA